MCVSVCSAQTNGVLPLVNTHLQPALGVWVSITLFGLQLSRYTCGLLTLCPEYKCHLESVPSLLLSLNRVQPHACSCPLTLFLSLSGQWVEAITKHVSKNTWSTSQNHISATLRSRVLLDTHTCSLTHTRDNVKIRELTLCGRILSAIFLLLVLQKRGRKERQREGHNEEGGMRCYYGDR